MQYTMSRLIVKNLPSYLSDVRLREHFAAKGTVTDVKLMRKPDGSSRKFGFVGFRSEEEARAALEYFNRTYIDTARIQVDIAKKIGDEDLPDKRGVKRANPAEAEVQPAPVKRNATESAKEKIKTPKVKEKGKGVSFEEFMAVMQPKMKRKTWQNEDAAQGQSNNATTPADGQIADTTDKKAKKSKKSTRDQGASAAKKGTSSPAEPTAAPAEEDPAANDEGLTDLEYMRRRMRHKVGGDEESAEKAFEQSDSEAEDEDEGAAESGESDEDELAAAAKSRAALEEKAKKDQETVDAIMQTGRLFVRNLPFSATEVDIEAYFSSFGSVSQVHIPLDKSTKISKGLAYVTFADPAHALAAFRARDGETFQGRLLHLIPAVDKNPRPDAPKTLKQNKQEQRKAEAGKDFSWGMLYMNSDAVASSIANRLGLAKSDILNPEADNAAVRLALAETRIIQETKEFLDKEGINVDAFNSKQRSDNTILVKNIPYGTTVDEIREMFSAHGDVGRVLMPPAGTIAVVEFPVAGEARTAFRALAYKRIKNSILYLEKAPADVFKPKKTATAPPADEKVAPVTAAAGKPAPASKSTLLGAGDGSEAEVEPGATLFVKNLSFATTDVRLGEVFGALSDYAFARVQTKPDTKNANNRLSMGYGFVGFRNVGAAQKALKAMDGFVLDGHTLAVKFAKRGHDSDDKAARGGVQAPSAKMIVKNLPFEATKRDVRELFGAHGQLKSVRVPKKFDQKTRGFAFIEFVSRREAESAFSALKHTHLLGRHLVLQWSGEVGAGADVEKARIKTGLGFVPEGEEALPGKKQKLRLGDEDIAAAAAAGGEEDE